MKEGGGEKKISFSNGNRKFPLSLNDDEETQLFVQIESWFCNIFFLLNKQPTIPSKVCLSEEFSFSPSLFLGFHSDPKLSVLLSILFSSQATGEATTMETAELHDPRYV
jgi:hypothetical protein